MNSLIREKTLISLMAKPSELREALLSMDWATDPEKRQKAHWEGKVLMLEGKLAEAITKFSTAIIKYGPHIAIRSDLATCYYLLGMPNLFEKTLLEIKAEIPHFQDKLHPVNQVRSALIVGKLFEEIGHLHCTYELYQDTLKVIEAEIANPVWIYEYQNLYNRILAQILRFNVQYGFDEEAKKSFGHLAQARSQNIFPQSGDEILHALFMYSLNSGSLGNIQDFKIQTQKMTEDSVNLSFYESLELEIRWGDQRTYQSYLEQFPATCSYDRILKAIYIKDESTSALIRAAFQELPRASVIRCLFLYKLAFDQELDVDLENALKSHFANLSHKDQNLWNRWAYARKAKSGNHILEIHGDKIKISGDGIERIIDLGKKKLVLSFISAFIEHSELSWESLSETIWEKSPEASDYDRMRMLVKRVNDLIHPQQKSFVFKDLKICRILEVRRQQS